MNALRNSLLLVLAAAVPAALVVQATGSSLFSETVVEGAFAALASVAVLGIGLADYVYRRPRDIFVSASTVRSKAAAAPVRHVSTDSPCCHLGSLTATP